jgi:hypothetical protein
LSFEKGNQYGKGRPPGSLNKRSQHFLAILEKHNFCAASALIECYSEAKKIYDSYGLIYDAIAKAREHSGNPYPLEDNAHKYLKIAADVAKEIAGYSFPKLKAIDHNISQTENLTLGEKLKMVEQLGENIRKEIASRGSDAV